MRHTTKVLRTWPMILGHFKRHTLLVAMLVVAALIGLTCTALIDAAMCEMCPSIANGGGFDPDKPSPPAVSMPDIALQVVPCLDQSSSIFKAMVAQLTNGITQALQQLDVQHDNPAPVLDVRTQCQGNIQTIAVWLKPPTSYGAWDTQKARLAALPLIQLLNEAESFSFSVTADAVTRLLDVAWRDLPKQMNDAGEPDPHGHLHLKLYPGYSSRYFNAVNGDPLVKQVITNIYGWYDGPTADDDFTVSLTDTLQLQSGLVACHTDVDVDLEVTLDTILNAIFSIVDSPKSLLPTFVNQGPACRIAALLPPQVLLPGLYLKEVFTYTRLNVNPDGITVAGSLKSALRTPAVSITGPNSLKVEPGDLAEGLFHAITTDLRLPLTLTWSSPKATTGYQDAPKWITLNTMASMSADIVWHLGNLTNHQQVTPLLSVSVTDVDGFTASTSKLVTIEGSIDVHTGKILP